MTPNQGSGKTQFRLLMVSLIDAARFDGSTVHMTGLASAIHKHGYHVKIVIPRSEQTPGLDPDLLTHVAFSSTFSWLGLPRTFDLIPQIGTICRMRFVHDYRILYIRFTTFTCLAVLVARIIGMRVVVEHNSWSADDRDIYGAYQLVIYLEQLFQVCSGRLSHLSRCVSQTIATKLQDHGVSAEKLRVIGNGTDTEKYFYVQRERALEAFKLDPSRKWLGFLGSMAPWQGLETAVRAFRILRTARDDLGLILAGDGPERSVTQDLVLQLGLEHDVVFLDEVSFNNANLLINCFDIALAPYTRKRNADICLSAIKIRNYAAAGRIVLASDLEGIREFSNQSWLTMHEPDDACDLAAKVVQLLDHWDNNKNAGKDARRFAEQHFKWDGVAAELIEAMRPFTT